MCEKFGFDEKKIFPCTIGLNKKEGINKVEFKKYVFINIIFIYPNVADFLERGAIKTYIGPGHNNNIFMCAQLRKLGVYLYPGVPNTTSVSQENNQGYGMLKSGTWKILADLGVDQLAAGKNIFSSIHIWEHDFWKKRSRDRYWSSLGCIWCGTSQC